MKNLFFILSGLFFTVSIYSQPPLFSTGNTGAGTSYFVGTTDNTPLILKVNNQWAGFTGYSNKNNVSFGYLSLTNAQGNGTANTALGAQSLQWNSTASGNVAIGTWALEWCTQGDNNVAAGIGAMGNSLTVGNHNVAIGQKALFNNKQSKNTAVGSEALFTNTEGTGLTAMGFRALCNNTTGEFNTAFGYNALLLNNTGFWNVALGSGSLQNNRTGRFNTAGGNSSLHFNETGVENTAFGEQALGGNLDGSYNTAVGVRSLWSVLYTSGVGDSGYGHGGANTALGYEALKGITSGEWNVGVGVKVMQSNTTGHNNVAVGGLSLMSNTTGNYNIAIGSQALRNNTIGSYNTVIGSYADVDSENLTNVTVIGNGAIATASNQVRIGNSDVTSIGGFAPWSNLSDGRADRNIRQDVPGLNFINKLQPVTYNLDMDVVDNLYKVAKKSVVAENSPISEEEMSQMQSPSQMPQINRAAREIQQKRLYSGFVAQDVENVAKSINYEFDGVDVDESGVYGLRYSGFVVPLVKATQELSKQINTQNIVIDSLVNLVAHLEAVHEAAMIASLEHQVDELTGIVNVMAGKGNSSSSGYDNAYTPIASMEQNFPNPFNNSTTINYNLPQTYRSADIVIVNVAGKVFKRKSLTTGPGASHVIITKAHMTPGVYYYSLYVDNKLMDSKKMIITK